MALDPRSPATRPLPGSPLHTPLKSRTNLNHSTTPRREGTESACVTPVPGSPRRKVLPGSAGHKAVGASPQGQSVASSPPRLTHPFSQGRAGTPPPEEGSRAGSQRRQAPALLPVGQLDEQLVYHLPVHASIHQLGRDGYELRASRRGRQCGGERGGSDATRARRRRVGPEELDSHGRRCEVERYASRGTTN